MGASSEHAGSGDGMREESYGMGSIDVLGGSLVQWLGRSEE